MQNFTRAVVEAYAEYFSPSLSAELGQGCDHDPADGRERGLVLEMEEKLSSRRLHSFGFKFVFGWSTFAAGPAVPKMQIFDLERASANSGYTQVELF